MLIELKNCLSGEVIKAGEFPDMQAASAAWVKEEADLREANLCEANLRGANLYGANLCEADLREANLCEANLRGANLYGANLRGANLYGANLYGADLYGANLRGANLRGANLYGADLRGANLRGANLRGANLYGANLRGANLWDLGQDQRGYRFLLFFNKETKGFTVTAGCRSFTLAEAWAHWQERHSDEPLLQTEILARLSMAETIAGFVLKSLPVEKVEAVAA